MSTEVVDADNATAFDIMKTLNNLLLMNIEKPLVNVKAAANVIVMMRAPTTMQELDVSFINLSPAINKSLWRSVNISRAVRGFFVLSVEPG